MMAYISKDTIIEGVNEDSFETIDWTYNADGVGSITRCEDALVDNALCFTCKHAVTNVTLDRVTGCNRRIYALKHLYTWLRQTGTLEWKGHGMEEIIKHINTLNGITERDLNAGLIDTSSVTPEHTKPSKGGTPNGKTEANDIGESDEL